jgi:hypothetical protein
MSDQHESDRPSESIESMPAAPEADQGTRDADAPTWSAPTEGHEALPMSESSVLADTEADALTTAAADADAAAAVPSPAPDLPAPGARPELIAGDTVEVGAGGAQRIEGHTVNVNQGGAMVIRGDQVTVEQGGALLIAGRRVDVRDGGALIILAKKTSGNVTAALDWRGIAAIFIGLIALKVIRGRR